MRNKRYKLYSLLCVCLLFFSFGKLQGQIAVPGGALNTTFVAWLTPDSYTTGMWTNLITTAGTVGNFGGAQVAPGKVNTEGYNYHPVVTFDKSAVAAAPNQMFSAQSLTVSPTDNFTAIFVFKRKTTDNYDGLLGLANADNYNSISWRTNNSNTLSYTWGGTGRTIGAVSEGILTIDNSNVSANAAAEGLRVYMNGAKTAFATTQWNGTTYAGNGTVSIGGGRNNQAWYGYQGNLQEVILVRQSGNGHINDQDLRKIHSYLAIKYGITLNNADNYLNSDGNVVWNRTANSGYNYAIAGLGRDDATQLYQKQAQSVDNKTLSVFLGSTLQTLNSQNTGTLADKTYIIFGANGATGNTAYNYAAGTVFANGSITDKINYATKNVYKAQVTVNGVSVGPQTVNVKTSYFFATFVMVSSDPSFAPDNTRFYPIANQIATGVEVNDGDYLRLAGYQPSPGGVDITSTSAPYTLDLWVSGNNSTNSTWENLVPANYSLTKFSTNAPVVRPSRFNYHNELYFGNTTSSKLRTSTDYLTYNGDSYYVFVVSDATSHGNTDATLLTFNNSITNGSLRWNNSSTTNILSSYWATTQRSPNFTAVDFPRYGIATMNIANTGNGQFDMYLNGTRELQELNLGATNNTTGPVVHNNPGVPLLVGDASNSTTTGTTSHFRGAVQEIILLRKSGSAALMPTADIAKIHSYLAVKYGITLKNVNYVNSAGTVVWDAVANAGYSNDIFGLGRDDNSGLYQRQARNVNSQSFVAFLSENITAANVQNTGTLDDMQYMLIGSSGGTIIKELTGVNDDDQYANGQIDSDNGFNIQSPIYKAQVTGPSTSLTVKLMAPSNDFIYALVSSTSAFISGSTQIFTLNNRTVQLTINNNDFIKFIGFSPGPGGVNPNLRMWLRADDDASLTINSLTTTDAKLGYNTTAPYPDKVEDPENVPGVAEWKDLVHGQNYSWSAGENAARHFMPVYQKNSPYMNYHPTVRFWGNQSNTLSSGNGAYLSYPSGLLSTAAPTGGKHTAYFILNNSRFGDNNFVYALSFCDGAGTTAQVGSGTYPRPGYGVLRRSTNGVLGATARIRAGVPETNGLKDLFVPGATSMLGFKTVQSGDNIPVYFRVNGASDQSATTGSNMFDWSAANFTHSSILGSGPMNFGRILYGTISEVIFYDRDLLDDEANKVESYLAFKYGITLRPTNNTTNRFNYMLSDNTFVWRGDQPAGDNKFADYYNNVAAVIRDDAARLLNLQSHSTDVGTILHLGVAGTVFSDDGSEFGTLNNMEAVAFGCNSETGNTAIETDDCGAFTNRFNRKWLIHKNTENGRPIEMLVGAQNNAALNYGENADAATVAYYSVLTAGYNVTMLVASSPANLDNGIYTAAIPMTYINGEHQCRYVFTDEDTYITFGYRGNKTGCEADAEAQFTGTKVFKWTDWTTKTSTSLYSAPTSTNRTMSLRHDGTTGGSITGLLGDNVVVNSTSVTYPIGVSEIRGYPRVSNTPVNGSLLIERRRGSTGVGGEMIIEIDFNHPVIPEFSISDLDSYSNCYEEVQIEGICSGITYLPVLSYAADPKRATYKITGNTASVNKRMSASATNKNGMVNVAFEGGVTSIIIRYRTTNRNTTATRNVYISPITLRPVPPPVPVNEDGLSFAKQVKYRNITTCEPVEYSFYIQNANCAPKTVQFKDILSDANLTWLDESIGIDAYSSESNPELYTNNYANSANLEVNDLVVPGASTLVLTATAVLNAEAPSKDYGNRAVINYNRTVNDDIIPQTLKSVDRESPSDSLTVFHAEWVQRLDSVKISALYSADSYRENSIITVTYTINNPNDIDFTDMFFDIEFSTGFEYVNGSFQVTTSSGNTIPPVMVVGENIEADALLVAGTTDGFDGFTIPNGQTVISFKLKAPANIDDFPYELDEDGNKIGPLPLIIGYATFSTAMDDPCSSLAISGVTEEEYNIPFNGGITHIISNKNVTSKIKKVK